ncbi:MAG TPA: hypothetical protein VLB68_14905 [Pyrinomonadaceae bacterium]|nr:hypothetical protein [Pyrinomonadaceae bacterium]
MDRFSWNKHAFHEMINGERVDNRDVDHEHLSADPAGPNSAHACFVILRVYPPELQFDRRVIRSRSVVRLSAFELSRLNP